MKVALDATPLTVGTGGVSRYTAELAISLARTFPGDEFWLVSDQRFEHPCPSLENLKMGHPPATVWDRRWWLCGLPALLRKEKIDIFHGTDFAVPYRSKVPNILTLHDLSPWLDPRWHTQAARVRRRTPVLLRLGLATLVLTPSEAIRQEAIARFALPPGRVCSVPLAASDVFRPMPGKAPGTPYFLFVGTLEPRKNLAVALQAWRQVRQRHRVDLVIAGRRREDFAELQPEPGLQVLGAVPNEALPGLYSGCLACLYPSLYEGFGLPVLEAMQCGAAVITSRDPAVVETSGGAAMHLDARDESAWAKALEAMVENPDMVTSRQAASLRRAAHFSWESTARRTYAVYEEAIRRSRSNA